MALAEFRFRRRRTRRARREKLQDAALDLLAALRRNGQIEGEWVHAWKGDDFSAWCEAPAADSLDSKFDSPWVTEALEKATAVFGAPPDYRFHGDRVRHRSGTWRLARSLILFTHFVDRQSPVCRGRDLAAIPVYTLPLDQKERQDVVSWAEEYRVIDALWMGSGTLEMESYRQMADPARPLLVESRRLARLIEERTSRPTYTFVHRYYGRKGEEGRRRCPVCGGKWKPQKEYFPLRCEPCRLVSDVAVDFDEPRLARIGDWVPSSRPSGSRRSTPRPAR